MLKTHHSFTSELSDTLHHMNRADLILAALGAISQERPFFNYPSRVLDDTKSISDPIPGGNNLVNGFRITTRMNRKASEISLAFA